jgi:hypothetical protein
VAPIAVPRFEYIELPVNLGLIYGIYPQLYRIEFAADFELLRAL